METQQECSNVIYTIQIAEEIFSLKRRILHAVGLRGPKITFKTKNDNNRDYGHQNGRLLDPRINWICNPVHKHRGLREPKDAADVQTQGKFPIILFASS